MKLSKENLNLILVVSIIGVAVYFLLPVYNSLTGFLQSTSKPVDTLVDTVMRNKTPVRNIQDPLAKKKEKIEFFNPNKPAVIKIKSTPETPAKKEIQVFYQQHFSDLKQEIMHGASNILQNRYHEINNIFNASIKKIPGFVNRYYSYRNNQKLFVNLMNNELLQDETLDLCLTNTAMEFDQMLEQRVEKFLKVRIQSLNLGTDTALELKRRVPTAKDICQSIYAGMEAEKLNCRYKSTLWHKYEELSLKYPVLTTVSKTAFAVIVGYIFPPSILITAPILVADFFITDQHREDRKIYTIRLKQLFADRRKTYQNRLKSGINEIAQEYFSRLKDARFLIEKDNIKLAMSYNSTPERSRRGQN
jgi:hypothetical protein